MAQSKAQSVDKYLAALPLVRRETIAAVREVVLDHLPEGYKETMQYGMIGYVIPLETYPVTYNGQPLEYAALASQKNYVSLYLMNIYGDEVAAQWFTEEYKAGGKRLDMGKPCVRFRKLEDVPMGLIGQAIARTTVADFIKLYKESRRAPR